MARRTLQLPVMHRTFPVSILAERADGAPDPREQIGQGRRYRVSISSEQTAPQWYWELGLVNETLSHKKSAVLLERLQETGAVLWNHDRYDQVGRLFDPEVVDARVVGDLQYSRTQRGQDFELDGIDGIRVSVSVGYRALEMKRTKRGDPEKGEIDEYLITKWEPMEMSIVSIPADVSVGLGRHEAEELARRSGGETFPAEIEDGDTVREESQMPKTQQELDREAAAAAAAVAVADPPIPAGKPAGAPAAVEVRSDARDAEILEIAAMARQNGMDEKVREWVERKLTPAQVAHEIVKARATSAVGQGPVERRSAIEDRDLRSYSLRRAILMTLPKSEGGIDRGGIEAEVDDYLDRHLPPGIKRQGGILIPTNMPGPDPVAAKRAARELGRAYPLDSATSTEGTEFKFTQPGPFIDMLRAKLITARLGARFMPGLTGPTSFPRQTGGSTAAWQDGEATAISDSMAAFNLMTLTPKTLIDTTGTTKQLLRMASEDFEALLRNDILLQHRVAIDTAAFVGTGANGQPSGVYVLASVQSYDVGPGAGANEAPTYIDITSMIGLLGDANADDGAVAFAMTPLLAATLMRTLTFPSANTGGAIWTPSSSPSEGLCAGIRAMASNVLSKTLNNGVPTGGSEHGLVLGNFNEMFIGEWGAFEVLADPYSSKKSGIVELTSFQMVDVNLRHPASFVKGINAIP